MIDHKLQVTPARCDSLFRASRASELNNTEFEAEAERFFRAGCLAWKKPH